MPDSRYPIAVTRCPDCGAYYADHGDGIVCPQWMFHKKPNTPVSPQPPAPQRAANDTGLPLPNPILDPDDQQNAGNGPKNVSAGGRATKVDSEADLLAQLSTWLEHRGYWPRDAKHIGPATEAIIPPRGWYVHLHECRTNPYLPDGILLGNDGRWLALELKAAGGRLRAGQADLLIWPSGLCYSLAAASAAVEAWEVATVKHKEK